MNVLIIVDLPAQLIADLVLKYPRLTIRAELNKDRYEDYANWADIVFGNLPVGIALKYKRLKWLQIVSSGIDAYLPLTDTEVEVTSAKGVHSETIAHHVMMMILVFSRNFLNHRTEQKAHKWNRKPDEITSLSGKRLGLIGYGSIGQQLGPLAQTFGMEVVAVKRTPVAAAENNGIDIMGFDKMDDVLATSDHVVICLPYTPQTIGMFDAATLGKIKHGAYLHNVSRGETIDEAALAVLLKTKHIAGAALDVFAHEPLPPGNPFWDMPNVIVTPHIAGHYNGLREATFRLFKKNLASYLCGQPMVNRVVFERGY